MQNYILITGSTGFVGRCLTETCKHFLIPYRSAVRFDSVISDSAIVNINNIDSRTDWSSALENVEIVIHMAARAHIMNDASTDPLKEYRTVNTEGTLNFARQAAAKGVKRFIFVSSVKVNGETTSGLLPFSEESKPSPQDPYGISKMEAESGLHAIATETGMEVVIIRPPLVYGPGVKANFYKLLKISSTGLPLPFGAVHNKRSMIYVGNLVDFIIKCIDHPAAANQTFLISDGEDLSLARLFSYLRSAFDRPARLLPVPIMLFKIVGFLSGKQKVLERLVGDLQVDSRKAQNLLDWQPPFSIKEGVEITVNAFIHEKS